MTRRLRIEWQPGDRVTAKLAMPTSPLPIGVLLAHGAGAGQSSQWVAEMRRLLAEHGHPTMTFDYPYVEAGRRSPDPAGRLEACHRAAAARLITYVDRIILAGKSMGGRIGGHVAEQVGGSGMVFYGYPLVSTSGKVRPLDHLEASPLPKLFVSGSRDPMAPTAHLRRAIGAIPNSEAAVIDGGDHSLKVPKSSGLTLAEVLAGVAQITADWMAAL